MDTFVLVESPVSFRGTAKPLAFAEHRDRFAPFLGKIRHVVVDDMPATGDPWARERFQRNAIRRGLADADAADTVIISDVDEVLRPAAIAEAVARQSFCFFTQDLFYFYLNWRATSPAARLWSKAFAAPARVVQGMSDLSVPREQRHDDYLAGQGFDPCRNVIDHAGWHFSWTGGVDRLRLKMDNFSHSEPAMQRWNDADTLAKAIGSQRFFYDGEPLENLAITHGFPPELQRNQALYAERGLVSPNAAQGVPFYEPPRTELLAATAALHVAAAAQAQTVQALQAANEGLQAQLAAIEASRSWRVTAPLRRLAGFVRQT